MSDAITKMVAGIKASNTYIAIADSVHAHKRIWVGSGAALVMVALFASFSGEKTVAPGVSVSRAKLIETRIKKDLIDPESLQVEWWPYHEKTFYCGMFNAKNRMGGYTGKKLFAALVLWGNGDDSVVTMSASQDEDSLSDNDGTIAKYNSFIEEQCIRGGYKQELVDVGLASR